MTLVEMMNPFAGKTTGEAPDEVHQVPPMTQDLEKALRIIHQYDSGVDSFTLPPLADELMPVLTAPEINRVLGELAAMKSEWIKDWVSYLIDRAYKTGVSDFILTLPDDPFEWLLTDIASMQQRPLRVRLIGSPGYHCAEEAQHCIIDVTGTPGPLFANSAKNIIAIIRGDATTECANDVTHSTFYIHGSADSDCATCARESNFYLAKNFDDSIGYCASNCVFYTPNEELLGKLRIAISEANTTLGNTAKLIDKMPTPEEVFK